MANIATLMCSGAALYLVVNGLRGVFEDVRRRARARAVRVDFLRHRVNVGNQFLEPVDVHGHSYITSS